MTTPREGRSATVLVSGQVLMVAVTGPAAAAEPSTFHSRDRPQLRSGLAAAHLAGPAAP